MAATAAVDYVGALTITSLLNVSNINTNSGSASFDTTNYVSNLFVVLKCGAGVSGTVIVPSIKAGADTNISNANNWVLNGTNFSTTAADQTMNIDLRASAFGSTATVNNKYIFLSWLITGSATANSALEATIVGQKKVSA